MLCGKDRVRTQDLGYQAERYDHCATRPGQKIVVYFSSNLISRKHKCQNKEWHKFIFKKIMLHIAGTFGCLSEFLRLRIANR
jgi:hypothetical protein